MSQLAPKFGTIWDAGQVLPVFGLEEGDLLEGAAVQTVSTGTPQLMVPLADVETLRRSTVRPQEGLELRARGDFFSMHLFALAGATEQGDTFARHFTTPPDLFEDPYTGSATGGMGAYLWHHGLITESTFIAEQGHWMGRPGSGHVEVIGPPDAIETVRVGGAAAMVLEGTLTV